MKKKLILITGSILMVLLSVFIYSCNKQDQDGVENTVPGDLLEAAQEWHSQQTQTVTTLSNEKKRHILQPLWKEARLHGNEIIIPSPTFSLSSRSEMDLIRKFVFKVDGDKVTDGNIIEMYAKATVMKGKKADLFQKYRAGNMGDFTGGMLIYDVKYKFIKSELYENGVKVEGRAYLIRKPKQQTSGKDDAGKPITTLDWQTDCYDEFWVNCFYWPSTGEYNCNEPYITGSYCYTYWENGEAPGGDPNNWGSGDGGSSGGGGSSTTTPDWTCANTQKDNFHQTVAYSETDNTDTDLPLSSTAIDDLTRNVERPWGCLKGFGNWKLISHETGKIKYVPFDNGHRWEWQSLEHNSITKDGSTLPGVAVTYSQGVGTPHINSLYSSMALSFSVTYSFVCDCPNIPTSWIIQPIDKNYTATSPFWLAKP
jgi:hypothetical protein